MLAPYVFGGIVLAFVLTLGLVFLCYARDVGRWNKGK